MGGLNKGRGRQLSLTAVPTPETQTDRHTLLLRFALLGFIELYQRQLNKSAKANLAARLSCNCYHHRRRCWIAATLAIQTPKTVFGLSLNLRRNKP